MTTEGAIELFRRLLMMTATVAGPVLLASLIVGLVMGVLQTATQVNEQSLSFVAKLLAVGTVLIILGPEILVQVVEYTRHSIMSMASVVN